MTRLKKRFESRATHYSVEHPELRGESIGGISPRLHGWNFYFSVLVVFAVFEPTPPALLKRMASLTATQEFGAMLDRKDVLRDFRKHFFIPSKGSLKSKKLSRSSPDEHEEPCIYLCGNSLGLQPRRTPERIQEHLSTWAQKGVTGHFREHEDAHLKPFLHVDEQAAEMMAPIVGASAQEVAVMESLTANLHLMLSCFYSPTNERYKIILENKAFPSDHVRSNFRNIHASILHLGHS